MKLRQRQRPQRISAGDAAEVVVDVLGTGVKTAGEALGPALAAVSRQIPEVAERIAKEMQPVAEEAQKRAAEAVEVARERSGDLAERVVQAAYEASNSLPPDTRKKVQSSLRKAGVKPKSSRHISSKWVAAGVFASAGVAFLFSGTVQDKVYDLVDRLRGEEMDDIEITPSGNGTGASAQSGSGETTS